MKYKMTEQQLDSLLETLNDLICEEGLFNRTDRENLIRSVASIGMLKAQFRVSASAVSKEAKKKKVRETDPLFPRHGTPWTSEDELFIHSSIDHLPDEAVSSQITEMAEKLGKTPYAIALKIMNMGRFDKEWAAEFKGLAEQMRQEAEEKSVQENSA